MPNVKLNGAGHWLDSQLLKLLFPDFLDMVIWENEFNHIAMHRKELGQAMYKVLRVKKVQNSKFVWWQKYCEEYNHE